MKIAILGAGAMGSLYGGLLSQKNEVYLIDIWQEHVEQINKNGLVIQTAKEEKTYRPQAVTSAAQAGPADLVIIFVKSVHTDTALAQSRELFCRTYDCTDAAKRLRQRRGYSPLCAGG